MRQIWIFMLMVTLSGCSITPKSHIKVSPDEVLRGAVEVALVADGRVDAAAIGVTVAQGIVELSGALSSFDEVRRALRRAGEVDGVRGIVNRLRVIGP